MPDSDPSATFTPRRARSTDRAAVWTLVQEFAHSFVPEAPAFSDSFDAVVDDPRALVIVAESDERIIVGYLLAHLHHTFFANAPVCWIEELMVARPQRLAGVGHILMTDAETWAADHGAAYIALATRRAAEFYRAVGYVESATFFRKSIEPH